MQIHPKRKHVASIIMAMAALTAIFTILRPWQGMPKAILTASA